MRYVIGLALMIFLPCWAQTPTTGRANASAPCSVANTGNNNIFKISCGIDKVQGQKMLDILNKILANQLDPDAVMKKLDEILKAVNPNLPVKTYFCSGQWRTLGPGPNAGLDLQIGGDDSAFQEMLRLYNSGQFGELLKTCLAQTHSAPEWLTPRLLCSLAYLRLGDRIKAREMLAEFDSRTGPAYTAEPCQQMSNDLHKALQ